MMLPIPSWIANRSTSTSSFTFFCADPKQGNVGSGLRQHM
ncbi:hypothetical protein BN137_3686 [Cronobacter condimenti 1330]|uniref:Uncharacterized protein n=1 Tax=Cronobacter condimenti 1330 TaxID=1073999 RepID=K8A319_9ENTR|nr:hypothetical protein BN137_3686 [Cronobacter condimenti 1330]